MTSARMNTLANLRGQIERLEEGACGHAFGRVALGHVDADAALSGGLARGAMHEVFAEGGRQGAAAAGFVAGLARRVSARRPLLWVRQDFTATECGALSMSGLAELGCDPRQVVTVHAADAETALRVAADGFACARARSCRQPQAHAGGAQFRRHRTGAASCGHAIAQHGGDAMDRARGAFAAG